jgi:hypothetical protein
MAVPNPAEIERTRTSLENTRLNSLEELGEPTPRKRGRR